MTKKRSAIPRSLRDTVLREYNHKCAVCSAEKPQIHHIDEDPANNNLLNLIPLCPNCHLSDQHDASNAIPVQKLRFFRQHKHRNILRPQFNVLFRRMELLRAALVRAESVESIADRGEELSALIRHMHMGAFFAEQIDGLVKPEQRFVPNANLSEADRQQAAEFEAAMYAERIRSVRPAIDALIVELLDFQTWNDRRQT